MLATAMALAPLTAAAETASRKSALIELSLADILPPPPYFVGEPDDAALLPLAVLRIIESPRTPLARYVLRYAFGSSASLRPFVGIVLGVRREPASPIAAAASYDAPFTLAPQAGFALSF